MKNIEKRLKNKVFRHAFDSSERLEGLVELRHGRLQEDDRLLDLHLPLSRLAINVDVGLSGMAFAAD